MRFVSDGLRRYAVVDALSGAPEGRERRFPDDLEALGFFRALATDSGNAAALGAVLDEATGAHGQTLRPELPGLVAELARRGAIRVVELPEVSLGGGHTPPRPVPPPPPPVEETFPVRLVELAEVVVRGDEVAVSGAVPAPKHARFKASASRAAAGGGYRQFVNLPRDLEGAPRHPEHGREVTLRARVEWTGGDQAKNLAGQAVHWTLKLTHKGKLRPASLQPSEREGLGAAGGPLKAVTTTGSDGWTEPVTVVLSEYTGDTFQVQAQADEKATGAASGAVLATGAYVTWHKFWYQLTSFKGAGVPAPATAAAAYDDVGAAMVAADPVTFDRPDIASPATTLYPRWMVTGRGADATEVVVIGAHNWPGFRSKLKKEAAKPVKGHLLICEHQWDPADAVHVKLPAEARAFSFRVPMADWNYGIVAPPLQGATLVTGGTWKVHHDEAFKDFFLKAAIRLNPFDASQLEGVLTDAHVTVVAGRGRVNEIRIELPPEAPDPKKFPVVVELDVACGAFWGGESKGNQMMITYGVGKEKDYQQAVAHEFGHGFGMVPATPASRSLTRPNQYTAHGGSGSHCSTGADTSGAVYKNGTCIMFHQLNPSGCTQKFCDACQPHLRLGGMAHLTETP